MGKGEVGRVVKKEELCQTNRGRSGVKREGKWTGERGKEAKDVSAKSRGKSHKGVVQKFI